MGLFGGVFFIENQHTEAIDGVTGGGGGLVVGHGRHGVGWLGGRAGGGLGGQDWGRQWGVRRSTGTDWGSRIFV